MNRATFIQVSILFLLIVSCKKATPDLEIPPRPHIPSLESISLLPFPEVPLTLQLKYNKGDVNHYLVSIDQSQQMTGKNVPELKTSFQVQMAYQEKVVDVVNDQVTLDSSLESSHIEVTPSVGNLKKKIDEMIQQIKFRVILLKGKIESFEPAEKSQPEAEQIVSELIQSFRQLYPEFPSTALKNGSTWTVEKMRPIPIKAEGNVTISMRFLYTLLGVASYPGSGKKCAVIKIAISLKIAGTVNEAGIEANTEGEGTGEGVMYFDYEKGVILGAQMDSLVKNTIKAKGKQEDRILNQDIKTTFILQMK